ncbi:hypothetical protein V9K97_11795 [Variovorax sp. CCNWLW186]|uniref:hypothetical protein n=1 Tax=Variovorax sp. CCNWLW186 TaxID=3127473 RepID=UPI00307854F8
MPMYPKPDFPFFFKTSACLAIVLVVLHWLPEIATWLHATIYGQKLSVEPRRFRLVLLAGYALVGISLSLQLAGLLWASWHHRKRAR